MTVLSFLCGGLAMALAVVLTWVEVHRKELTSPAPSTLARPVDQAPTPPVAPVPAAPSTLPQPSSGSAAPNTAATPSPEETAVARAVTGVQTLYAALNAGDQEGARQRLEGSALRQLDPDSFRQFSAVGVGELRPTGILGSSVTLEGVVTFVNPDSSQRQEPRSFTVDISRDPPRITATAAGRAPGRSR